MTRILADLSDDDIKWLERRASEQGKSRAAVLRDAVATYKSQSPGSASKDWVERGAGLWKDRIDIADGAEHQRAMRKDRTSFEKH
jgi:hypothetical protein